MKKSMCSAVALLAGAVAIGASVHSASAATITYTQNDTPFSAGNPSPTPFNPSATVVQGNFSNSLAGSVVNVDRSPYQNANGTFAPGDATKLYSGI